MGTAVIERPEVVSTNDGSHDKFAHIVLEGVWITNENGEREWCPGTPVVDAIVYDTAVQALCGKVWQPSDDPQRFPLCPTCKEIAEERGWKVPTG